MMIVFRFFCKVWQWPALLTLRRNILLASLRSKFVMCSLAHRKEMWEVLCALSSCMDDGTGSIYFCTMRLWFLSLICALQLTIYSFHIPVMRFVNINGFNLIMSWAWPVVSFLVVSLVIWLVGSIFISWPPLQPTFTIILQIVTMRGVNMNKYKQCTGSWFT